MVKRLILSLWFVLALLAYTPALSAFAQETQPHALILSATGALTPAMTSYIERGIQTAEARQDEVIILQLNTPGGSIDLMQAISQAIRASTVPVVVYITPSGAMAGSAGTVITLSAHASAMAPGTAIGAASPVDSSGQDLNQTEQSKLKNMTEALVREYAAHRSPEAINLGVQTIENAKAASATEAVKIGLVDFSATDLKDLLRQLDGFKVQVNGQERVLHTANIVADTYSPSLIEQILQVATNPNIVFLLLTVGVQALLIELANPGGWVPGFIGVSSLALATYGLGILPVNWFGLVFIITAFVLFILDIKAPTHGALTAAGSLSLVVGGLVLFNTTVTPVGFHISPLVVISTSVFTSAIFAVMVSFAVRAQREPLKTGSQTLIGKQGVLRSDLSPFGTVQVAGELWSAEPLPGQDCLPKGTKVEVAGVDGIRLQVKKLND